MTPAGWNHNELGWEFFFHSLLIGTRVKMLNPVEVFMWLLFLSGAQVCPCSSELGPVSPKIWNKNANTYGDFVKIIPAYNQTQCKSCTQVSVVILIDRQTNTVHPHRRKAASAASKMTFYCYYNITAMKVCVFVCKLSRAELRERISRHRSFHSPNTPLGMSNQNTHTHKSAPKLEQNGERGGDVTSLYGQVSYSVWVCVSLCDLSTSILHKYILNHVARKL